MTDKPDTLRGAIKRDHLVIHGVLAEQGGCLEYTHESGWRFVTYGDNRPIPVNLDAKTANERRKLHWRDRFALWLAKHRRRWERA